MNKQERREQNRKQEERRKLDKMMWHHSRSKERA